MAPAIRAAHASALMIRSSSIGVFPRGRPSAPMALPVDLADHEVRGDDCHVHAAAQQLDAQGLEEAHERMLAGRVAGALGHPGESGDARHGNQRGARARPSGVAAPRQVMRTLPRTFYPPQLLVHRKISDRIEARPHRHAGVVDEHVQVSKRATARATQSSAVSGLRWCDVGGHRLPTRAPSTAQAAAASCRRSHVARRQYQVGVSPRRRA